MAAIKKYNGSTWETTTARKYETKSEIIVPPTTIYCDGNNAILSIKGNTVQNGTPTPSNPVDVNGVGERAGNLFDKTADYAVGQTTYNYTISGLDPDKYYTCSTNFERISGIITASIYFNGGSSVTNGVWSDTPRTFKPNSSGEIIVSIRYKADSGAPEIYSDVMAGTIWVMVNKGNAPLPHEPYGIKIPISSGGVTTNVYLGSTQTVRQIKKLVFDGTEDNWRITGTGRMGIPLSDLPQRLTTPYCTHFIGTTVESYGNMGDGECSISVVSGSVREFGCYDSTITTLADFKTWLQQQYANGTPVTVWYVLATPQTAAVNEPLMKIGDSADTLSNAASIPTTEGANSITVDTTVQPSEFTATWTGWHNASVKKWDGSDWQ